MSNRDSRRTFTAQPAGTVCGVRRIGDLDSDILELKIGSSGYCDGSPEFEIDALYSYVPFNTQCSIVPVRAFVGYDRAVLERGKRVLRQHWQGQQQNQRGEFGTGTGHDCAQE
jgi:hypothetical protein